MSDFFPTDVRPPWYKRKQWGSATGAVDDSNKKCSPRHPCEKEEIKKVIYSNNNLWEYSSKYAEWIFWSEYEQGKIS